jgi:ABC-type sugar transport system substrate-binding protein
MVKIKPDENSLHSTMKKGTKEAAKTEPMASPLMIGFSSISFEKQIPKIDMGANSVLCKKG